ncbi:hypothetical protein OSTOST_05622 [Ostertagia ostertagi]
MSLASSSSCDGMPSKIHVESVGFRRPQMTRTTMSGVTRIARLPTLVTPPPEGNLQLIAATTPISTASPSDGDECSGRGMVPIDRRTGILTARRKDARKGQLIVSNERKKAAQVATNGCIRSKVNAMQPRARTTMTEVADCPEPPNFDRETAALVEQLVTSAISRATDSLKKEAEIAHLRRQAQNYKKLLEKLQQSTKLTIEEKDKVIESLQQEEARRLTRNLAEETCDQDKVIESLQQGEARRLTRNLAEETCDQITKSSMDHVEKLNETATKTRSIGLDTRSMSSHLTKLQLMTTELEQDFFPWMFAKADQMFRRTMTTIQLENRNN